jgi:phosphoribosyl 1,2-cyclic phosphodiesterase
MIRFTSIRSGSSGNLLLLESETARQTTRLLIDCGLASQRACRQLLEEEVGLTAPLDGLLVTHAHRDHVNYSSLRVMQELRIPVYVHQRAVREVVGRYLNPYRLPARIDPSVFDVRSFGDDPLQIGGLTVSAIAVPHAPGIATAAYLIRAGSAKLLIATDFHDPEAVVPQIYDCDFIYLESNYDQDLLRRYYNPASLFHMPNPAAGLLLQHAVTRSRRPPVAALLGHLSEDRNRPELALRTVRRALREGGVAGAVRLLAAPRYEASETIIIPR